MRFQHFASTRLILHMALLSFQKRRLAYSTCTRDRASVSCARSSELAKTISPGVILPEQSNSHQPWSKLTCSKPVPQKNLLNNKVQEWFTEQSNSHVLLNELPFRSKSSRLMCHYSLDDGLDDTHGAAAFGCA